MAFIKFKPLTPTFNFRTKITDNFPVYVYDYIQGEKIAYAYRTNKDVALFTDKQIVLFDKRGPGSNVKEICIIPYNSIVTSSIFFGHFYSSIKFTLYNTFPLTLNFLKTIDKVTIKRTYMHIEEQIKNKFEEQR